MDKSEKVAVSKIFEVPFSVSSYKQHETNTALNAIKDKLYVTDWRYDPPSVYVARLGLDGVVDNGFGGPDGWRVETLPGSWAYPAGFVSRGSNSDEGVIAGLQREDALGLVCFSADGTLNAGFGIGGKMVHKIRTPTAGNSNAGTDATDRNNKDQINGSAGGLAEAEDGMFYGLIGHRFASSGTLMRIMENGELDEAFGEDGMVVVKYQDKATGPVGMVWNGKGQGVTVVGTIGNRGSGFELFLARYSFDGQLDERFGEKGFVLFRSADLGLPGNPFQMEFNHVARHPDGGYFVGGYVIDGKTSGLVVRVDINGQAVKKFNDGKPVMFQVPNPAEPEAYLDTDFLFGGMSVQVNGKLVIGGAVDDRSSGYAREVLLVRFTDEGKVDTSFTPNGWLTFRPLIPSIGEAKVTFLRNVVLHSPNDETIYASADGGPDDNVASLRGFVAEIK